MITTAAPRTTLPRHSAGWGVMRLLSDRGGKNTKEHPAMWGKHRQITKAEAWVILEYRARNVAKYRRTRS